MLESTLGSQIQIEGIIEDIDIISGTSITAVQCKYHESQETFKISSIYKPILQMLKNYCLNPNADISYVLYAFFPSMQEGKQKLDIKDLEDILNTTNLDYISKYITYIKPCKNDSIIPLIKKSNKSKEDKVKIKDYYTNGDIPLACNLDIFLKKFSFIIGQSYSAIQDNVKKLLVKEELLPLDVEELFYPNAIQNIAELSIKKNSSERIIVKSSFINRLKKTKKTAITRWTKEVTSYRKLLKIRQKQLSANLNRNLRSRCFVLDPNNIENFDENIVVFLKDFKDVYCYKPKLHNPAIVCINNYPRDKVDNIITRLYSKGIDVETGFRGGAFFKDAFIKEPERNISKNWIQFTLRLGYSIDEVYTVINENKPDDIFIIGNNIPANIDPKDTNIEILDVTNFDELKYLLKIERTI